MSTETEIVDDGPATDIAQSNSLADLAARIRAEHKATDAALKSSVEHAMAVGDLLIGQRRGIRDGLGELPEEMRWSA